MSDFFEKYKEFENSEQSNFLRKSEFMSFLLRDNLVDKDSFFPDKICFDDWNYFKEVFIYEKEYFLGKKDKFRKTIKNEEFLLIETYGFYLLLSNLDLKTKIAERLERIILSSKNNWNYFIVFLRYNLILRNDNYLIEERKSKKIINLLFKKYSTIDEEITPFEVFTIMSFMIGFKNQKGQNMSNLNILPPLFYMEKTWKKFFEFLLIKRFSNYNEINILNCEESLVTIISKKDTLKKSVKKMESPDFNRNQNYIILMLQKVFKILNLLRYDFGFIISIIIYLIKDYNLSKDILNIIFDYNKNSYIEYVLNKNYKILFFKFKLKQKKEKNHSFLLENTFCFLDNKELLSLVFLSKKIRKRVYEFLLNNLLLKKLDKSKRLQIWSIFTKIFRNDEIQLKSFFLSKEGKEYHPETLEKKQKSVFETEEENKSEEELKKTRIQIEKDMRRTFDFVKFPEKLKIIENLILDSIVYHQKTFSYFQGLNNIAGFLYLYTENEYITKNLLIVIIEHHFLKYFNKNFHNINFLFFVLEIELKKNLPDLYNHFKTITLRIDSIFTSYIFTIFTSAFNYKNNNNLTFIENIFDLFLINSWKSIIIVSLYVLSIHKNYLLNLNFEEILYFFNKLNSNFSLFSNPLNFFNKEKQPEIDIKGFFNSFNLKDEIFDFYFDLFVFVQNDLNHYQNFLIM